jgi:hypothetical protein
LEFCHYDYNSRGTISAKDFALSLVASADINQINKMLDRVDELNNLPHLRDIRITFEEFKAFAHQRKELQSFTLAIFSDGKVIGTLTKKDFQRAATQVHLPKTFLIFSLVASLTYNQISIVSYCYSNDVIQFML